MSLLPSRLVFAGFEGTGLDRDLAHFLERTRPGGVVLFARNIAGLEPLACLVRDLKAVDPRLLVAIDQEGGPVDRLRPHVPSLPSALALGAAGAGELAQRAGQLTGELLGRLGIDLDFAPVCDLALSRADNAIGLRSFGADLEQAARLAGEFLRGLEDSGVAGCLKHFPGLGLAAIDSHRSLPVIAAEAAEMRAGEIAVFEALVPDAAAVMVGHAYYPHLTRKGAWPASLSEEILTGLLKEDLRFSGAAFTDDLAMGAVGAEELGRVAVRALGAGADALLVCEGEERVKRVIEAVAEAAAAGQLPARRLEEAHARIGRLRGRATDLRRRMRRDERPLEALLEAMRGFARETAALAVLRTRGAPRPRLDGPAIVLRPRIRWLSEECARPEGSPFLSALAEAGISAREVAYDSESADQAAAALVAEPSAPGCYLLATYDAHHKPLVGEAARTLTQRAPVHHLALGLPDDLPEAPLRASVSTLGCGFEAVAAGVRVLTGAAKPRGKLVV